jgi:hypothetical protein
LVKFTLVVILCDVAVLVDFVGLFWYVEFAQLSVNFFFVFLRFLRSGLFWYLDFAEFALFTNLSRFVLLDLLGWFCNPICNMLLHNEHCLSDINAQASPKCDHNALISQL